MRKKVIILSVIAVLFILNFIPFQYNGLKCRITLFKVYVTDYVGTDKNVIIPEKIFGFPIVSVKGFNSSEVESVIINANIKEIKDSFSDCSLKNIKFPKSLESISGKSFYGCNIQSITLPKNLKTIDVIDDTKSDMPNKTIFSGCPYLKEINVDGNNSDFESIDGVLYNRYKGTIIRCPEGKNGNVTVPDWVNDIDVEYCYSFEGCSKINTVSIPNKLSEMKDDLFGYTDEHPGKILVEK